MKGTARVSYTANLGTCDYRKQAIQHLEARWESLGTTEFKRGQAFRKMMGYGSGDNRLTMQFCHRLLEWMGATEVVVESKEFVA